MANALVFGSCAPVRYRAIEPGEIELETRTARNPPAPVSFRVRPSFTRRPAHKATANALATQIAKAKDEILECIDEELDAGKSRYLRLTIYAHAHGVRLARLSGVNDATRRLCAEKAIRSRVSARVTPPTHLTFTIHVGARPESARTPPGPIRKRGTVEILSNADRAEDSLALGSVVLAARPALLQCLARTGQRGIGRAAVTLTVGDGAIAAADVETDGEDALADCWASALSGASAQDIEAGGFECALAYGSDRALPVDLELHLAAAGLLAGDKPIEIDPTQLPPRSRLYDELLALRFADRRPSPAPAILHVAENVGGAAMVAVADAARAADIDIVAIEVGEGGAKPLQLSTPRPRLGRYAARTAAVSAIVGSTDVWLGVAMDLEERTIATTESAAIAAHIKRLASLPGIDGRRDALLGLEPDATAAGLRPVLEALRSIGFDRIELVSAETARARLAR